MNKLYFVLLLAVAGLSLAAAAQTIQTYSEVRVLTTRYDPFPAQPGNDMTLYVELYNLGPNDAYGVNFSLNPSYPFSLEGGQGATASIPSMAQGSGALLQYTLRVAPNAIDGSSQLQYILATSQFSTTATFNVSVARSTNLAVTSVSPRQILPGESVPLQFTLSNLGNSSVEGVSLSFNDPTKLLVPIGSGNTQFIGRVDGGAVVPVNFTLFADPAAAPGAYLLNVNVTYLTSNSSVVTIPSQAGIIVGGDASLDVSTQGYANGQLSLAVANIGSTPAYAVSIVVPPNQPLSVSGADTSFLGNLNKGDFTVASFTISPPGQGGIYTGGRAFRGNFTGGGNQTFFGQGGGLGLRLQLLYTDTLGNRHSVDKMLPIDPSLFAGSAAFGPGMRVSGGGSNNTLLYAGAAVLVIVLGYFGYKKYVKKK